MAAHNGAAAVTPAAMLPDSGHDATDPDNGTGPDDGATSSSSSSSSSSNGAATLTLPRELDFSI